MIAIKCEKLCKKYKDVVAVDGLDLEVKCGGLFSLLGVNGAGKTTLVKMLTTTLSPTSGDAFLLGNSIITDSDKVRADIDICFQETAVARKLTVKENVVFYAKLCGKTASEIEDIKRDLYDKFGFSIVENKRAENLSGGWQRKLAIALALIKKPKILFLDEPTLGLDVLARRELWSVIRELKKDTTIVLTTHYMEEAEELADEIGVMKSGRLLFVGTKDALYGATGENTVEKAFIKLAEGNL